MKYLLFIIPFFFVGFFVNTPYYAFGQADDVGTGSSEVSDRGDGKIENPLKIDNIQDLLAAILSAIVQIAIPFLVLAVMWVGFLFVAARGNPNKLADARQALFYTLLGALIILGAQTLSVILSGTISQLTEGVGN